MVEYKVIFSKLADKDKKLLKQARLDEKAMSIIDMISVNPYQTPPIYERLRGNLDGLLFRRINLQHRLVYKVHKELNCVVVHSMWSHYGEN